MGNVPGFCGLKNGGPRANSPMTTDPNADLIGYTITVDGMPFTVVCTWDVVQDYVLLQGPLDQIIRVAS